jgi:hypothetical protein
MTKLKTAWTCSFCSQITTDGTEGEEHMWYRSLPNPGILEPGLHTLDTESRLAYRPWHKFDKPTQVNTRFSAHLEQSAAHGIGKFSSEDRPE